MSYTGLTLASTDITGINYGQRTTAQEIYFDDIAEDDASYPGAGRVIVRQPKTGTPFVDSWTKFGSDPYWADLAWDLTNYATSTGANADQTKLVAAFNATQTGHGTETIASGDTINSLTFLYVANRGNGAGRTHQLHTRINSISTYLSTTLTTSDLYYQSAFFTPTISQLDTMEAGGNKVGASGGQEMTIRDLWAMVDYTPASGTSFSQSLSAAVSMIIVNKFAPTKIKTETFSFTEAFSRISTYNKSLTSSLTFSELLSLTSSFSLSKIDAIAFAETMYSAFGLTKTEALILAESSSRDYQPGGGGLTKSLTDAFAIIGSITRIRWEMERVGNVDLALSEQIRFSPTKVLSDSFVFTESLIQDAQKVITDTLAIAELISTSAAQQYEQFLSDSFVFIESLVKSLDKIRSDSFSITESLTRTLTYQRSLIDSFIFVETNRLDSSKTFSDLLSLSETKIVETSRYLTDSFSILESLIKSPEKRKIDIVSFTETFRTEATRRLTHLLSITESFKKEMSSILSASFLFTETHRFDSVKNITDSFTLTETANLVSALERSFIDAFTFLEDMYLSPELRKTETLSLAESISVLLTLQRSFSETLQLTESKIFSILKSLTDSLLILESIVKSL